MLALNSYEKRARIFYGVSMCFVFCSRCTLTMQQNTTSENPSKPTGMGIKCWSKVPSGYVFHAGMGPENGPVKIPIKRTALSWRDLAGWSGEILVSSPYLQVSTWLDRTFARLSPSLEWSRAESEHIHWQGWRR